MSITKEEFFKDCESKTFASAKDLEKTYQEALAEVKAKGIPEKDLEKFAMARMRTLFKRQFASDAEKFVGFILGDLGVTDYGAGKKVDNIKKTWKDSNEDNRQRMIREGVVDASGNPLWVDHKFKKGMIEPAKEQQRKLLLAVRKETEPEYKLGYLTLKADKLNIIRPILGKRQMFRANLNKDENGIYFLNQASVTEFVDDKSSNENVLDAIKKTLKPHLVKDLTSLAKFHEDNKESMDRIAVVKANVVSINKEGTFSNILTVDDDSLEMEKLFNCLLPKDYPINFVEGALDCVLIGRTQTRKDAKTEEEVLQMSLYGILVDDAWKISPIKAVSKEDISEEEKW